MSADARYDNDDYVAKLLAEDAKKSSKRYSTAGLSALLPPRPRGNAPKPNTRFLNHIVREADNHNAALKKKEEMESRIRLRQLRDKERGEKSRRDEGHDRKRRRTEADSGSRHQRDRSRDRRRSTSPYEEDEHKSRERHKRSRKHEEDRHHHNSRSHRHRSPNRERLSKQPGTSESPRRNNKESSHKVHRPKRSKAASPESDPLEDIVGPLPPASGRKGHSRDDRAYKSSRSNIDAHFSPNYDPSMDVHPDSESVSEREDWDMALEALRDRATWKKKQSDRLREAGFGEDEIRKWEKSSDSTTRSGLVDRDFGDIKDVRWAKKGEAREWDLGKQVVDDS